MAASTARQIAQGQTTVFSTKNLGLCAFVRRWVVEVAHSWFNRFRKLLVRYERTDRSFIALNMLAAAVMCFRKIPAKVNIIYG
ncbi:MAG: transposase [Nitrosospira sp.]